MDATIRSSDGQNYNIISPTAKYVLLFKGNTDIPYAKEVAELISLPGKYEPDFTRRDVAWWASVLHFEQRYKSINQLLLSQPAKNVLELSSGYSFRGVTEVREHNLYYIDTDLPEMICTKKELMSALLQPGEAMKGMLEVMPLNALDQQQFAEVASRFPNGELAIVNEGLLMYLGIDEKRKLCKIIRNTLQQRGGCWITADIYIRVLLQEPGAQVNNTEVQHIFDQLHVKENMFESMEAAVAFFREEGFVIDKEATPDYTGSNALKYLLESATEEQRNNFQKAGKIHATWRLKLADEIEGRN